MTSQFLAVPSPWLWLSEFLYHSFLSIRYDSDQENDFSSLPSLSSSLCPFLPPAVPLSSVSVLCLKELLLEDHTFFCNLFIFFLCFFFLYCFSAGGFSLYFSHFLSALKSCLKVWLFPSIRITVIQVLPRTTLATSNFGIPCFLF